MAMLLTSFGVGGYQTISSNAESSSFTKFDCTCGSFDRREIRYEEKVGRRKELVFRDNADHLERRYSFRKHSNPAYALSSVRAYQAGDRLSRYLFRTQDGGQVKVGVGKNGDRYSVHIEILPSRLNDNQSKLIVSWGIYRSDSSFFIPLEFQSSAPDGQNAISETAVLQNSTGTYVVEMEFEPYLAPFYLSFTLKFLSGADPEDSVIKSHRNTNFTVPVGFTSGNPAPLGVSFSPDGSINFAIFCRNVETVVLCLFDDNVSEKPALEIELDPYVNRTGDIWHASFDSAGPYLSYGYRCKRATFGNILLDPYAKILRKKVLKLPDLGELRGTPAFDWSDDVRPGLPVEKLVVYRLNVKNFTSDKSSNLPANFPGTFSGVAEKLQHFKSLGINAILLEPVFPYNERKGPYLPIHFFSPMQGYGPAGDSVSAINSMREMVKKMHASGIEVYLEVVFTHSAGTLEEVDFSSYYHADGDPDMSVQNSLKCNYPIMQQLIIDSLQYWVTEFHIDGFCFINASYLLRGSHGESLSRPPLIESISFDPLLSKTKIIADYWDPYDLISTEVSFPHWKRWAEINTKFAVDVKNFLRGKGLISNLATRLCGSGDIFFAGRGPSFSFNFIARNSGLPLVDLVSFSSSELASELSWNCGEDGPTDNKVVLERRLKQIRNFLFILFVSLGVPVLNMGDECGLSTGGSPEYSARKPFNWNALHTAFGVQATQFVSFLNRLRERRSDLLQKKDFLEEEKIGWYHSDLSPPKWDDPSVKFLAMELKPKSDDTQHSTDSSLAQGDIYVAFNAGDVSENIILPSPPENMEWIRLVDTALPYPGFFLVNGTPIPEQMPELITYEMKSHSCVLFEAKVQHA